MRRRDFLKRHAMIAGAALSGLSGVSETRKLEGMVMTVLGPVRPSALGLTLPHEHIMSTFGDDPAEQPQYDKVKLLATVLPYLAKIKNMGCRSIADCTAAYFGRDAALLRDISKQTGIRLLTNTGYYAAAKDRYVPDSAREESADQIAARWLREWQEGIGATGIRPGFMKLGVDEGPLSEMDRKLIRAAARAHRQSGMTIAVHTGDNPAAARAQLAVLREEGVSPQAWIWVHAQSVKDEDALMEAAMNGAWLEFDGIQPESLERHLFLVRKMKDRQRLEQVLLSHDGNSYRAGRPPKPYDALFTHMLPALKKAGFDEREIRLLTTDNPARAFTIRVRTRE